MALLKQSPLRLEDRILWEKVARSTKPLAGREFPEVPTPPEPPGPAEPAQEGAARQSMPDQMLGSVRKNRPHPDRLDENTHRKLAKGRLALGARIDLHGLTQREAHGFLYSFLYRAHANGLRHVLVITGKGSSLGSDGILRQAVPHWFATPSFRALVSAWEFSHQSHGGAGAIYVRLRRNSELRKT